MKNNITKMTLVALVLILNGCSTDTNEIGGPADIPFFLLDGGTSSNRTYLNTGTGKDEDQLVEVMDADTYEFKDRTLELYLVKAPELNNKDVMKSQAAQCTEADVSVIEAMAKKSKEYVQNNTTIYYYFNLDLKTKRDRFRKQIGTIYKVREDGSIQTMGISLVRSGYAVPSNYKSNDMLNDAKYQVELQKYMADAIRHNRGLWADFPAEMECLSRINQH